MSANGYLRPDELTTVQGDMQLRNDFARVFFAMRDDCAEETHQNLTLARPAGAYRPWAMQLDMRVPSRRAYYNITPGIISGLPSEHGLGTCGDIATCLAWVKANGHKYGVTFPLAKTDPNHARYDGVTIPAGESGTPITATPENHLPEYGGANVALVMNRTQDNVLAIYDESHWQEFAYTSNMQPTAAVKQYQIDFAVGQSHALPNVPYDAYAWDLRSNKTPAIKRPLFTDTGSAIIPLDQGAASLTDAQVKAIAAAIVIPSGASKADVTAAVKVGTDAVIANIPTKLSL